MYRPDARKLASSAVAAGSRLAEPLSHGADRLKRAVSDTIDDQLRGARRSLRRTRHAAEDMTDDLRMYARRQPVQTLALALGIGALIGVVIGWSARATRRQT